MEPTRTSSVCMTYGMWAEKMFSTVIFSMTLGGLLRQKEKVQRYPQPSEKVGRLRTNSEIRRLSLTLKYSAGPASGLRGLVTVNCSPSLWPRDSGKHSSDQIAGQAKASRKERHLKNKKPTSRSRILPSPAPPPPQHPAPIPSNSGGLEGGYPARPQQRSKLRHTCFYLFSSFVGSFFLLPLGYVWF